MMFSERKRTYLRLNELFSFLTSICSFKNSEFPHLLFLIGILYLSDDDNVNGLTTNDDFSTFFANHYLRESAGLDEPFDCYFYVNLSHHVLLDSLWDLLLTGSSDVRNIWPKIFDDTKAVKTKEFSFLKKSNGFQLFIESLIEKESSALVSGNPFPSHHPSNEVLREIQDKGISVVKDFLDVSLLGKLRAITMHIAESEKESDNAYLYGPQNTNQRIYNLISKHQIYRDLVTCRYLDYLNDRVFERPTFHEKYGISSIAAHLLGPGATSIPWHVDSILPDPIPSYMIRFICVITLDEFTLSNGSTQYIPNSHLLKRKPTANDQDILETRAECVTAPPGSLIMWDGSLWHRSSENRTNSMRGCLILSFASSIFMEICGEEEHLTVVPGYLKGSMNQKLAQMIGHNRAVKKGSTYIPDYSNIISY